MSNGEQNGWAIWSKHVLLELERLNDEIEKVGNKLDEIRDDVIMLKTKASLWGGITGLIVAVAVSLITKLMMK